MQLTLPSTIALAVLATTVNACGGPSRRLGEAAATADFLADEHDHDNHDNHDEHDNHDDHDHDHDHHDDRELKKMMGMGMGAWPTSDKIIINGEMVEKCGCASPSFEDAEAVQVDLDSYLGSGSNSGSRRNLETVDYTFFPDQGVEIPVYFNVITDTTNPDYRVPVDAEATITDLNTKFASTGFTFVLKETNLIVDAEWHTVRRPPVLEPVTESREFELLTVLTTPSKDASALTIYARNIIKFFGYAYYPWLAKGEDWDGVFVQECTLVGTECRGFEAQDGDTLVHEVGHWLGLYHNFQFGCRQNGDFVDDTPNQLNANTVGCMVTKDTCPSNDNPFNDGNDDPTNFMDYSPDACLNHFSEGQIQRMQTVYCLHRDVHNRCGAPVPEVRVLTTEAPPVTTTTTTTTTTMTVAPPLTTTTTTTVAAPLTTTTNTPPVTTTTVADPVTTTTVADPVTTTTTVAPPVTTTTTTAAAPIPTTTLAPPVLIGGSFGDPHFLTWNSSWFDFMGACDLVLLDAPSFGTGLGLVVHIRTMLRAGFSYIESSAIRIGQEDVLEVSSFGLYSLNGIVDANMDKGVAVLGGFPVSHTTIHTTEGHSAKKNDIFTIELGPSEHVEIHVHKDLVSVKFKLAVEEESDVNFSGSLGLMGSWKAGIHLDRSGKKVLENDDDFGQEWQVRTNSQDPQLFSVLTGAQYPEQCKMPGLEKEGRRRLLAGGLSESAAELACAHFPIGHGFDQCVYDVIATQDLSVGAASAY